VISLYTCVVFLLFQDKKRQSIHCNGYASDDLHHGGSAALGSNVAEREIELLPKRDP
jgi:hypothetical protein